MPLPDTVRVKLSSEAAEYVSITPVVVREMPLRELIEQMLGVTGKDESRIQDLLLRGALVSGASRFRWTGWQTDRESLRALLDTFPDPDPARLFASARCVRAVLRGAQFPIGIPRGIGSHRKLVARLLRRPSFWDHLMQIASIGQPRYLDYSYRERADVFQLSLSVPQLQRLRETARLMGYSVLETQVRTAPFDTLELYTTRE